MVVRAVWAALLICAVGGILALTPVSVPIEDGTGPPPPLEAPRMRPVGDIREGRSATQEFPAAGTRIHTLSLLFGTYQRTDHGMVTVVVQARTDGQWRELATRMIDKSILKDNLYYTITFSPQLVVAKGQPVRVTLSADGGADNAITWWTIQDWLPDGYSLTYGGRSQPETAYLRVAYAAASGTLGTFVVRIWDRLTLFLDPPWQVVLLISVGLLGAGAIGLVRFMRDLNRA